MQSFNKEKFMESDVALSGLFVSVSLVLSYIEAIIPINLPVPGMKLGLANIVIIWVLYSMGIKAAAIVSLVRVILAGFMFGNMYSIIFSMAGALLSLITMYFLKKIKAFSIIGVSIAGGVMHNAGQIIVSMIVLENVRMAYYFPALMISGVVAGIAIGLLGGILYRKIKILPQNTDRGKK